MQIKCSDDVGHYLRLKLAGQPDEYFGIIFLTSDHRVISCEVLFKGTVGSTTIYPRAVVQRVLQLNAVAVVLFHNHPSSGRTAPSKADEALTTQIKNVLAMIDVKVLDHLIVGNGEPYSFARDGLL